MTKTKFINAPLDKEGRKSLRIRAYEELKSRKEYFLSYSPMGSAGGRSEAPLDEYGVEISYIKPGTFADQDEGYLRYLLDTGGPREEIRFYHSPGSNQAYKILFCYSDYSSSVHLDITGEEWGRWLFQHFVESGELESLRELALR